MANYLITGGLGCVGSNLFEYLSKLGHKLTIIDKQIYGSRSQYVLEELTEKYGHINYNQLDLCNYEALKDFIINNSFDGIFHLAALPSHRISLAYPYDFFQNDLLATINILEVVRQFCPKTNIVFSSTNKVYADNEFYVSENSNINTKGPYAIAKYQSEEWCNFYSSRFGLKINIARLFHIVGPRMQPSRETVLFTNLISQGQAVDLHGRFNPDQTFDSAYFGYTSVHDTVKGLNLLMTQLINNLPGSVYNIGSSEKVKVEDIVKHIATKLGKTPEINYITIHEHETMGCVADSSKIIQLGWKVENNVWSAISEYVDWHINLSKTSGKYST